MGVKSWQEWSDEIAACTRAIPDELLRRVAQLLSGASIVLTAGNGGSASLASHAAQALMKPDYVPGGGKAAVCLTDGVPTLTAQANDAGWDSALTNLVRPFLAFDPSVSIRPAVVWLFSSSGKSENVVRAANTAKLMGHQVVAFTGFEGEPLRSLATISVHVESNDYEVVEPVHDALLHRVQYHVREMVKVSA